MHVRDGPLCLTALPDGTDAVAFGDGSAPLDRDRTQVGEGDRVAIELDRHRSSRARHDPGERDSARDGRANDLPRAAADIDPSMLTGGIRVGAEGVRTQHGPLQRPRPGSRRRGERNCPDNCQSNRQTEDGPPPDHSRVP